MERNYVTVTQCIGLPSAFSALTQLVRVGHSTRSEKTWGEMLVWLYVWNKVQTACIWSRLQLVPLPLHYLLLRWNPEWLAFLVRAYPDWPSKDIVSYARFSFWLRLKPTWVLPCRTLPVLCTSPNSTQLSRELWTQVSDTSKSAS